MAQWLAALVFASVCLALFGCARGDPVLIPDFYRPREAFIARMQAAVAACSGHAVIEDGVVVAVHIRTRSNTTASALPAVLVFGEHARELISPELGLALLSRICAAIAGAVPLTQTDRLLAAVVGRGLDLTVVPLVNPWGRARVLAGDACRRTNAAGVDLNRNWAAHWAPADASTLEDSMPGQYPFSEAETRTLRRIIEKARPRLFLTVHSGTVGMYYPPAFTTRPTPEQLAAAKSVRRVLEEVATTDSHPQGSDAVPISPAGRGVAYSCPGTCLDYAFEHARAPLTVAFEVWAARPLITGTDRQPAGIIAKEDPTPSRSRHGHHDDVRLGVGPAHRQPAAFAGAYKSSTRTSFDKTVLATNDRTGRAGASAVTAVTQARPAGGARGRIDSVAAARDSEPEELTSSLRHRDSTPPTGSGPSSSQSLPVSQPELLASAEDDRPRMRGRHLRLQLGVTRRKTTGSLSTSKLLDRAGLDALMDGRECMQYFNPLSQSDFDETLRVWQARTVRLLYYAGSYHDEA